MGEIASSDVDQNCTIWQRISTISPISERVPGSISIELTQVLLLQQELGRGRAGQTGNQDVCLAQKLVERLGIIRRVIRFRDRSYVNQQ